MGGSTGHTTTSTQPQIGSSSLTGYSSALTSTLSNGGAGISGSSAVSGVPSSQAITSHSVSSGHTMSHSAAASGGVVGSGAGSSTVVAGGGSSAGGAGASGAVTHLGSMHTGAGLSSISGIVPNSIGGISSSLSSHAITAAAYGAAGTGSTVDKLFGGGTAGMPSIPSLPVNIHTMKSMPSALSQVNYKNAKILI